MPVYSNNNSIKNQKKQVIKNRTGIALICISSVLLINLIVNLMPFLNSLLLGTFGLLTYAMLISGIVVGIMLIKNIQVKLQGSDVLYIVFWMITFITILHLATTTKFIDLTYGKYLSACFKSKLTCGGILFALITYPVNIICTHLVASFVILSIVLVILTAVSIVHFVTNPTVVKKETRQTQTVEEDIPEYENENDYVAAQPKEIDTSELDDDDLFIPDEEVENFTNTTQIVVDNNEDKQKAKSILGLANQTNNQQTSTRKNSPIDMLNSYNSNNKMDEFDKKYTHNTTKPQKFLHSDDNINSKPEQILSDKDKKNLEYLHDISGGRFGKKYVEDEENIVDENKNNHIIDDYDAMDILNSEQDENKQNNQTAKNILFNHTTKQKPYSTDYPNNNYNNNNFNNSNFSNNFKPNKPNIIQPDEDDIEIDIPGLGDDDFGNTINIETEPVNLNNRNNNFQNGHRGNHNNFNNNNNNYNNKPKEPIYTQGKMDLPPEEKQQPKKKPYKKPPTYIKPPIDLLKSYPADNAFEEDYNEKAKLLEQTLEMFNVPATVVSVTKGPAFSRFEMQMKPGVPVNKIQNFKNDIAMTLESNGDIRLELPIPGRKTFGIEIPNKTIDIVPLKDILQSSNFQASKSPLTYALGKDISASCKFGIINKAPHMLVAGQTGSGKSVCLNSMLISLLYKASPEDVKIILVDPKRVEFTAYNGLPHMLIPKAITEPDKAVSALTWLIGEMERRFTLFAEAKVRDLEEFNNKNEVITGVEPKLPYIVFIIDELGDLMLNNKKEVEEKIIKLTQKSRAAGIHLVVATQRPSVNVITGLIKGNLPCRIAFAVAAFADSKTILDQGGAESLLGKGDMLYSPGNIPAPLRIQGTYVSSEEVAAVVNFVKENNPADFDEELEEQMFNPNKGGFNVGNDNAAFDQFDVLLKDAVRTVVKTGQVSISKVQRQFGLGYPRAAKIVDQMEAAGFISPQDEKKLRVVYITQQEFEERFGEDL